MRGVFFLVRGRVQGVGYRYFVLRQAQALGLVGWVRNRRDGTVEVLAAGEEAAMAALEGRLWSGPPLAHVAEIEVIETLAPEGVDFAVLPTAG